MRIASGVVDQVIYFVAVDSTDFATRETGLTTFTVYRSRNGGAAAAMTTPTVTEVDATNMQGVYKLLLDEDMTLTTGNLTEEMVYHITQADMAPVTRTIELYQQSNTDYTDGRVWVDSTAANTNTVYGVDGTAVNPVSTDAAAISVGSAFIGIWNRYNYATGSTSTLSSGYTNHEWYGQNYDLNLNGQALDDCYFEGATITGVATCTNGMAFEKCKMDTCTLDLATIKNSIFVSDATITLTTKASPENAQPEYTFFACGADHYNANVPTIAMPAGACFLNILDWHGPIQFTGLIAGQVIHLSGTFDDIDLNAPASAATVVISGSYRSIIAEGSASIDIVGAIIPSIVQDNQTDANTLITNVAAVQTQVDKIPASDGTSGWNATALQAIQDECDDAVTANVVIGLIVGDTNELQGDDVPGLIAALNNITAADVWGDALPGAYTQGEAGYILGHQVSISSTVDGAASTFQFIDTARIGAGNNFWNRSEVVFHTGSNAGLKRNILDFISATGQFQVSPSFPNGNSAGDEYSIIPEIDVLDDGAGRVNVGSWLSTAVATVGGLPNTNIGAISADSTAADNLEAMFDGTGYVDTEAPATQAEIALVQADLDIITGADGVNLLSATQASIDAIEADTGTDGVVLSTATQNAVADAMLDRNMATGTDSGSPTIRTMRQALRFLRNKWSISGTTLTVTEEDDTTASWTSEVSTDAAADPVTGNDPASS